MPWVKSQATSAEWPMSHIQMTHGIHQNDSYHTSKWLMSHIRIFHGTHTSFSLSPSFFYSLSWLRPRAHPPVGAKVLRMVNNLFLQLIAVCCSVLQCVAVCCSVVAVCCSVLQCVAVCCSVFRIWVRPLCVLDMCVSKTCVCPSLSYLRPRAYPSVGAKVLMVQSGKENIGLFCRKWPIKIRLLMGLYPSVGAKVLLMVQSGKDP